jgi:hypothetical protein
MVDIRSTAGLAWCCSLALASCAWAGAAAAQECTATSRPKSGQGVYVTSDCTRYEGTFRGDYLWGAGKISYADGRSLQGNFQVNQLFGRGVETWPDGRRYEGQFFGGRSNGPGKYTAADGTVEEGKFRPGVKLHGWGTRTSPDGVTLVGEFRDGEPFGEMIRVQPDGSQQTVKFGAAQAQRSQGDSSSTSNSSAPPAEESPAMKGKKKIDELNQKLRDLKGIFGG